MSSLLARSLIGFLGVIALTSAVNADVAPPPDETTIECNRECLNGFVDQFFVAAIAHDPSNLQTTSDVRFTENGQVLPLGEGVWATISKQRDYKLYVPDASVEQVGFLGSIDESGTAALIALRLKIENLKVSEIEVIVSRPAQGAENPYDKIGAIDPILLDAIPEARQLPRGRLIEIANAYFDAIEKDTGEVAAFMDDCRRVENGLITAGDPQAAPMDSLGVNIMALNCRQQLDTKVMQFITQVSPRRFVAVDAKHGVVFTLPMFVHDGRAPKTQTLSNGEIMATPAFARRPNTTIMGEAFKIIDGKIAQIESVATTVPYGSKHGWELD